MSTNDNNSGTAKKERRRFGGQVPAPLEDEEDELINQRGYSQADIYAEGIRSLSDAEGIWRRRREFAVGSNPVPTEDAQVPASGS